MLATFDLRALGHNSARYIHVVSEALKLAFADRERYYGDREDALTTIGDLLAPAYLKERAALIRSDRAAAEAPAPGDPRHRGGAPRSSGGSAGVRTTGVSAAAADGTTHIAAIDREGNMICLTPSGGVFRKSAFAPELGCTLSTRSEMFVLEDDHPNGLVPGKRPRTTLVSYLICEGAVPTMTVGCPGGDDQSQADLQLVLNLLVFGMNPQQAVEAPRFSTQTLVNSFYPRAYRPGQLNVEPGIPDRTRVELSALGHEVTEIGACGIGAVVTRRDPRRRACSRPAPIRAARPTRSRGSGEDTMSDAARPPFRADHVGSLLRPPELREARSRAARGEIDRAALRAVEDQAIRGAVALQESVGLQSVTDGEFRRDWWHIDFLRGFDGVETSTQSFGVKFEGADEQPPLMKVTGKIRRSRAEHARPLHVPQVGHDAHGQVLPAVAGDAARPRRPPRRSRPPIRTSTNSGRI